MRTSLLTLLLLSVLWVKSQTSPTLFKLLPADESGIGFTNTITENDTLNILNQANIYNGGGIGVGDFNNDGRLDLYFAGNMVSNRLYLNLGGMKFQDQTAAAGVDGNGHWCTGVSVVDINADGLLDIYVSASFRKEAAARTNLLYINQGVSNDGIPHFLESAKAYGLADDGFSTQGYFFDYDHDGDLDLYQLTNALYDPKTPIRFRPKVVDGSALNTDRLYRNNGNGTFTNVSKEAGIRIEGWGHAACISDFNNDGWPDIYVADDFVSNDLLYINNRNGTFTNRIEEYFKHTAWNAMGTDVADINNDGFPDLISLEMLPEDNLRKKRMLSGNEYYNYFNAAQYGYQHQYIRNVLQLNSGGTPKGHPVFCDVGFMAGVYQTDWSWCPLVADFDNDGFRDIIITNGLPRDVTDLDYVAYDNKQGGGAANLSLAMAHTLPVVNIPDYSFRNTGGVSFENTTIEWGLTKSGFSNGGAYADLDNDGDLDFVVNNINEVAFLYENTLNEEGKPSNTNSLAVTLQGKGLNRNAFGTRLHVYAGATHLFYEHQPARGYLSTVDPRAHFGVGAAATVDSIRVIWPDGTSERWESVSVSQPLTINWKPNLPLAPARVKTTGLFNSVAARHGVRFKPAERDFIDYTIQPTLPHKLSQYGPGIAVGDIDKNGFEDFYVGGTSGNPGLFFLQDQSGHFRADSTRIPRAVNELQEEMGVLLFDADNDGDLDLYAVSGSYEIPPDNPVAQDRLFLNDGKGKFALAQGALPQETTNGSCVRAADFDRDGDLDLFVGGRVVSGAYPSNPKNFILRNDHGKFTDITAAVAPELTELGMVTDALWSDFDQDGQVDLIIAGEWTPITFFHNENSAFKRRSNSGAEQYAGWWNSLTAGDFDDDGDMDYVAGNLGLNSNYTATEQEPMELYAKDLDKNGSLDAMLFCYLKAEDGSRKAFPMHAKDDLVGQLVSIRKKFPTYKSYGLASENDLWSADDKKGALHKTANYLQSAYLENDGKGHFSLKPLPYQAQAAPVYGMQAADINADGNLDLVLVGNDYGMEPYSGRHDAFNGLCLRGDGHGNFQPMSIAESGFFVPGDAKGFSGILSARKEHLWIVSQNQDSLLLFGKSRPAAGGSWVALRPDDVSAEIIFTNGRRRAVEFYYGSTYLSQSSRYIYRDSEMKSITITNFRGLKRKI